MSSQKIQDTRETGTTNPKLSPDDSLDSPPSSNFGVGEVLSSISASASALLSSVTSSSASSITDSLTSSNITTTKLSNLQYPSSSTSTHSSASRDISRSLSLSPSPSSILSSFRSETQGLRSHQLIQLAQEDEFSHFTKSAPTLLIDAYNNTQDLASDGQDVISLLSKTLVPEIYSPDPELYGINITHPTIRSFATCDDPVEYLSTTDTYIKEVWGDALEVVWQARKEVLDDRKGKRKQDSGRTAIERLRMIWGHLKNAGV